jgi:hypothetical protein
MSATELHCPDVARLAALRAASPRPANAVDYVEVLPSKRVLAVHCLEDVGALGKGSVRIEGGVRVAAHVVSAQRAFDLPGGLLAPEDAAALPAAGDERKRILVVRTDTSGDHSTYTLRLVAEADSDEPPADFDPILSTARFSFKVDCPSDFDCRREDECVEEVRRAPHIDYLAKDYASFRRLMLDRLQQTMPEWRERNPLDLGITLVEAIAYEADQLSYHQDAVATEAYLGTARRRASVRRHARLVDYRMHEGAAARAWICLEVEDGASGVRLLAGSRLLPEDVQLRASTDPADNGPLEDAVATGAVVFETLHEATLSAPRNAIAIHTWADPRCCLPRGATSATLRGAASELDLRRGDVLVVERVHADGTPISSDPQRHAVRLVADGRPRVDPIGGVGLTEIRWHSEDALPHALTLTEHPTGEPAAVARGNVVLAEHGLRVRESGLQAPARGRFRPFLSYTDLTHSRPFDHDLARGAGGNDVEAAAEATEPDPALAIPAVELESEGTVWGPERELLRAGPFAHRFVVEMHQDGRAQLRFGDGKHGRRPRGGQTFTATYRIGKGPAANVGADSLTQLRPPLDQGALPAGITAARNPLPATGGTAPEPVQRVRLDAPEAFRRLERAVTEADYAEVAERHPEVQKAAATRRWTGSWYTMFVTVDRLGGVDVDPDFERRLLRHVDRYRLAGYDVEVDGPRYAALDLELEICVAPGFVRTDVEPVLRRVLSSRETGGRRGIFHPDRLTFGQPVFLSPIVAAAMAVDGVERVVPLRFQRWREGDRGELQAGVIRLERLEIARLDDDASVPENGRLELDMEGGS